MKWVLLGLILFFVILVLTRVNIKVEYKREKENDMVNLEASIWFRLIRLHYAIPFLQIQSLFKGVRVDKETNLKVTEKPQKQKFHLSPREIRYNLHRFYLLKLRVHDLRVIAKETLRHFYCDQMEWKTRVGVGDAAATAVITGAIWGVKSMLIGVFSHYISLRTVPKINVIPSFQSEAIDTYFRCIVRFRIGHAIIAGTRILLNLRKGREGTWQNTLFRA